MATSQAQVKTQQEYDPWGKVRSGGISQTNVNYTGQRLDGTGLLYYHARLYDPVLGRFVSADTIVPGSASGAGGAVTTLGVDAASQLAPLTVDFHEPGFVATVNGENAFRATKGFWFQLSDDDKQQAKSPWGPANPQALNRYAYVLNNPLRYVDPTGHCVWDLCAVETYVAVTVVVTVATYASIQYYNYTHPGENAEPTSTTIKKTHEGDVSALQARKGDIKFIDRLAKKYNLTRAQRRELHDEITKQGLTEEEIEAIAKDIADRDGNDY